MAGKRTTGAIGAIAGLAVLAAVTLAAPLGGALDVTPTLIPWQRCGEAIRVYDVNQPGSPIVGNLASAWTLDQDTNRAGMEAAGLTNYYPRYQFDYTWNDDTEPVVANLHFSTHNEGWAVDGASVGYASSFGGSHFSGVVTVVPPNSDDWYATCGVEPDTHSYEHVSGWSGPYDSTLRSINHDYIDYNGAYLLISGTDGDPCGVGPSRVHNEAQISVVSCTNAQGTTVPYITATAPVTPTITGTPRRPPHPPRRQRPHRRAPPTPQPRHGRTPRLRPLPPSRRRQ